jgi:uncharacterized phage protein (TIGR02218 family)
MTGQAEALYAHLATGCTTVCHLWLVSRRDGVAFGFTDHDRDIVVDQVTYRADAGLTAQALQQTTGLSVDNSEAVGALSSQVISAIDILAGRYDGAEVTAWMANWQDPMMRVCLFRGNIGEITQRNGVFRAELRGLTDRLNQVRGQTFQRSCSAVLGDRKCQVNLTDPAYRLEGAAITPGKTSFTIPDSGTHAAGWFERGMVTVISGAAANLSALIKSDIVENGVRVIGIWESLGVAVSAGDLVRVTAGCDRLIDTCRTKFNNINNFRGFPHIPGEDWLAAYPVSTRANTGGSRNGGPA